MSTVNLGAMGIEWRNVAELEPGDILARTVPAGDRTSTYAVLAIARRTGTYAVVRTVDVSPNANVVTVATSTGHELRRTWRDTARLPVLVSTSENLSTS